MEHHIYRMWDMMKTKPICICSSDLQHQQLNYNCCFRIKYSPEKETTLKWWGTALSWMRHQTLQCQLSSSSQCPPSIKGDRGFPGQGTNTTKCHRIWLRFSTFALWKTAETSGCTLFSEDILMYFRKSGLCALCTFLLALHRLHHFGYSSCTRPTTVHLRQRTTEWQLKEGNALCICTIHLIICCGVDNMLNYYF